MTIRPGPIRGTMSDATGSPWDLVVIGGGIYGVCVALEAARRGLRPVLVERGDFGGGTSWSSHRIIHGGLRYLQSLNLPRFRDSIRERRWFAETLPELIEPLNCLMPLYGEGLKRPSAFRGALSLNTALAGMFGGTTARIPGGSVISADAVGERFGGVIRDRLRGGAEWHDGRMTSSERVLICLLRRACDLGAIALRSTEVTRILVERGAVIGVELTNLRDGSTGTVRTACVIDCGGPGVGSAEGAASAADRRRLFAPARAFNLVLSCPPPSRSAVAVAAREAGSPTLFIVPLGALTVAGTWHESAEGSNPEPMPSIASVDAFLGEIRRAIPGFMPTRADVRCVWSGLLPAVKPGAADPSDRAVLVDHGKCGGPNGLISVSGVKYTTARSVADQAVQLAFGRSRLRDEIGPIADPLLAAGQGLGHSSDHSGLTGLLRQMRDEESADRIEDAFLRRSAWYLDDPNRMLTTAMAEVYGCSPDEADHELQQIRQRIRRPVDDSDSV